MTAQRRRYTAKERAKATGIAAAEGVTAAERATGIPKQTIQYWTTKPDFVRLRTTAREMVADQFWVGIQVGLEQVIEGLRSDVPLKEKAVALATLYDRHALLTGGATARSESRDITGSLSDTDVLTAIRAAEDYARTGHSGTAETAPGAPEGEGL
jgi:hypothetical protein